MFKIGEDLYEKAQEFGVEQATLDRNINRIGYWTAWFAARQTAAALLNKAAELNLTLEQFSALTEVACEVAPD